MRLTQEHISWPRTTSDLSFRGGANWTAVTFFAGMAIMHACIAATAFWHGRWEGYMSAMFATVFAGAAVMSYGWRFEVAVRPERRTVLTRMGPRWLGLEQEIAFARVRSVRLTILSPPERPLWRVEIICDDQDIDCPATSVPREQALLLALTIGTPLVKVSGDRIVNDVSSRG
jgi:hypothetical protein